MSNLTAEKANMDGIGPEGRRFHVIAGATVYRGGLAAILEASGKAVALTTAGAGPCVGMFTHGAALNERVQIETGRVYRISNGATTDAFSDATPLYSPVFGLDDNKVADNDNATTLPRVGIFMGMEADGKVRVLVSPEASCKALNIQTGVGTLVAGVLTVAAGITVTATSRFFFTRVTEAGTDGDELRCPAADRTAGGPGTGAFSVRSFLSGVAATSDTSTIEWMIVG